VSKTDDGSDPPKRVSFLRALTSDYKAYASLIGLLIYGVVRVAYDAFYARLGIFPEAVGLSETTILGRAVLYLALTVAVTTLFVGLWLIAVGALLERRRQTRRDDASWTRRLFLVTFSLPLVAFGLVAAGSHLRSALNENHLAYYCFQRCKFSALKPSEVDALRGLAQRLGAEHPNYRFVDFGPEWIVVIPIALILIAAVLGLALSRRPSWTSERRLPLIVLAPLAVAAFMAGVFAPHLIAAANDVSSESAFIYAHPEFVRWSVFVLIFAALLAALLVILDRLAGGEPRRSPWMIAALIIVLPVLLGFFAPNVALFIQEEGADAVAAAALLWAALFAVSFWVWPNLREGNMQPSAALAIVLAVIVSLTLYLAWERGINLAKKAAMGDQILVRRFSLLTVRSSVVCLEPSTKGTSLQLSGRPYVYLGEAGGTLVLYDFLTDLARDVPEAFPVRAPASNIVVRIAHYNPHTLARWDCAPNS